MSHSPAPSPLRGLWTQRGVADLVCWKAGSCHPPNPGSGCTPPLSSLSSRRAKPGTSVLSLIPARALLCRGEVPCPRLRCEASGHQKVAGVGLKHQPQPRRQEFPEGFPKKPVLLWAIRHWCVSGNAVEPLMGRNSFTLLQSPRGDGHQHRPRQTQS